ncbi:nucleolus protein [Coprinopsis cinerea okayama7|uniref:25S rRNA adenine-N(1) methyltransferase n=1 Tax=Coprinopsis cinerea (strain Okayama-7 / 130 / ATCC MYA-4618 / FGSC 9003) TaxID=240176 RepID=A8NG13_COPC7|nr:nucleolus protein [Coprinopsis cinerea okayama7\|eukprot:XP_001833449.1 nucleolus protein [Coprinopsis cinerea okayama7\
MPKARKRKVPVVPVDRATTSASKPQVTRTVIREFHVLLKRQAYLQKSGLKNAETYKELKEIEDRIEELGGLERYQHMSAVGQKEDRGGGSHRIFIGWLKELGAHLQRKEKLRLLEVGALKPDNYQSCSSWIDVFPIDLNSRHPAIKEQDFLKLDPVENKEKWEAISLSLVLNFVPDAKDRGRMLRLAHEMLGENGYFFVALPLPCLSNSRYLTFERFKELMEAVGFVQLREKWKEGGKMVYYLYQKGTSTGPSRLFSKKEVLRTGNRNNFCILLDV